MCDRDLQAVARSMLVAAWLQPSLVARSVRQVPADPKNEGPVQQEPALEFYPVGGPDGPA